MCWSLKMSDMCAVYKVSSSVKVMQMEAELWSHLSALKAEIEENRGAGSSNAYRFVCDVLFKLRLPKG